MSNHASPAPNSLTRSSLSILLAVLQVWIGIPASALAAPQTRAAPASAKHGRATTADVVMLRLRANLALAAASIRSALSAPTDFARLKSQFEEPLIAVSPTTETEDAALYEALRSYAGRKTEDDLTALRAFLSKYPQSGWRVALLTNLGLSYYHYGYFSKAIEAWEQAWQAGKAVIDPRGKALVDRAIGELMRMHARLGHAERLESLFNELGNRHVSGPATEAVDGAKEGLWTMRHDPGIAFLCGPMALRDLLIVQKAPPQRVQFLERYRSSANGVTLAQVGQLASEATLDHRLVFRAANEPVPVPSIVHWKVSHFGAIVGESAGRFHIQDPTFGRDLWVTRSALDAESSGYFLVPAGTGSGHWRDVNELEASRIRGMGYTSTNDPNATTPQDPTAQNNNNNNCGMCGYAFSEMTVSLRLSDTPVGYTPPIGPDVHVSVTYNQREASQPANFSFFNVSPKWTLNWLTYIQDDPNSPGSNVSRYVAGGGSVPYLGYDPSTGAFTPETHDATVLVLSSSAPIVYKRNLPNGGTEIYSTSNGATSYPRLIFLSKVIDPAGNAVTLNYDTNLRLTSISDATGRLTKFSYGLAGSPLLVTAITDPFGRSAYLAYDASGRLVKITDVLGLSSQFTYDASSLVNALTTPYGTTQFSYGDNGNQRYLQATDPLGQTERLEFIQGLGQIPFSDPQNLVPVGIQDPFNEYLNYRDTFYWDKHAYAVAAGDYTKARNRHWTHWALNTGITGPTVESIKYPFENRIWMNYPGQIPDYTGLGTAISGTLDKPTLVGRVLDDGTTQLTQISYNAFGHVTDLIDPVGRETQFTYAANGIDLVEIQQRTSASGFSTIAQFTYNSQHLPLTSTDAAGQTATYTYNSAGQVLSRTDALGEITKYQYDRFGDLTRIVNANGQTAATFTYDSVDRVATRTDSEGYTVSFAYDSFDRITQETYPDGTTRQFTWNKLDLVGTKDRQGNITRYSYDSVQNLVALTDPLNRQTKRAYYENGSLKTLTDPAGNTSNWSIDVENRVTGKTYADGSTETFTFENTTSRLAAITDALNQTKHYSYGLDDELTGITYTNSINSTPNVSFATDPYFRRVVSMTDGSGTTHYYYQAPGSPGALRKIQEVGPDANASIAYRYDALSRVVARTVDSSTETFAYDALGRPTSHGDALGTFVLTYLGQTGQVTSRTAQGSSVGTNWVYDTNVNDRRLKSITNNGAARSYQYSSSPENLISSIQESASEGSAWPIQRWSYNYDNSYRLTTASSSGGAEYSYTYDSADNIASQGNPSGTESATYNELNQITTFNSKPFTYDANGNTTDDGLRTYQWDAENRLVSVKLKAQPSQRTTFRYDGLSRRIAIVVVNGAMSTETRYLWCGSRICQARSASGVISHRYYAEGEVLPLSGALLYYAQDHLGSVRDVLAMQNGTRVAAFDYDPYGNPRESAGRISTDFRYAGLFYEQNSGLYLAQLRAYDPRTGRWLSRDPIAEAGGFNLYSYVGDDPLRAVDPWGLCGTNWWLVGAAAGLILLGVVVAIGTDGIGAPLAGELIESGLAEGGTALAAETAETAEGAELAFSQTTASPWFSAEGDFAGLRISDVAADLRAGTLAPADVPVQVVSIDGNTLIVNTRSSLSLMQAGIPQSEWTIIDMTGNSEVENAIAQRLANNGLTSTGTDVLRITGSGSNASTLIGNGTIAPPPGVIPLR